MHWAFCDTMDKIPVGYNIGNLSLLISIHTSQSLRALHRCRIQKARGEWGFPFKVSCNTCKSASIAHYEKL